MRKNKQNTTEYITEYDASSYQTGPAQPPRRGSGLVALLLVLVIFLGGMASALGIVNFHLLALQTQQQAPINPVDLANETIATDPTAFLGENDDPAPSVPVDRHLEMNLANLDKTMSPEDIYAHNERSLVTVYSTTHSNETLSGAGVVISADGYILTNAHAVEAAQRIFVYLADGRLLRAAVVGSDAFTDLAVLFVQAKDLTPALFAGAGALQPEQTVYALKGLPDEEHNLLLSGTAHTVQTLSSGSLALPVLQTSLHGDSGPIFDGCGQIVAIRAGKISRYFPDRLHEKSGIAIPAETVQTVVAELIRQGHISGRPSLGFQVEAISKLYQHYWDLPGGLLVTILDENCSACGQGLQNGDILLALDGVHLSSRADLYATLYGTNVGDELIAAVFRDGKKFTLTLTVEENTQG